MLHFVKMFCTKSLVNCGHECYVTGAAENQFTGAGVSQGPSEMAQYSPGLTCHYHHGWKLCTGWLLSLSLPLSLQFK